MTSIKAHVKKIYIGVATVVIIIFLSQIEAIINVFRSEMIWNGFHAMLVLDALQSNWMTLALPIVAALPCTASFVEDLSSGYIKAYLHRTTQRKYISEKLFACIVSGGAVIALGIIIAYGISALIFKPLEQPLEVGMEAEPHLANIITQAALFFCSGAFWSLIGMTLATFTGSKYMAYASPFIIYYVLIILKERYFEKLYIIYPKEWLFPSEAWVLGRWGVVIWLLELSAIMAIVFILVAKRKIRDM